MKKLLTLALSLVMALSVAACAPAAEAPAAEAPAAEAPAAEAPAEDAAEAPAAEAPAEEYTINFIFKHMANVYWEEAAKGAEQAAADMGFKVNVLAPITNGSNDEQVALIQQSIAQGVDAIVIAANDSAAIVPAAEEIMNNDITLVSFSTAPADQTYHGYVGIENVQIGEQMAQTLADLGDGTGTAIIIEGPLGQQNSTDRAEGAQAKFTELGIEVVARQSANWARTEALTLVQNLLQEYPDVKYIMACNDEMALGAAEAASQAGRSDILISGVDASPEALDAIKEGRIATSCSQDPYGQAYMSAELVLKHLAGEEIGEVIMEGTAVTAANVDEYLN